MKSPLGDLLNLDLKGGMGRKRLASFMILARELEYLKYSMLYAGMGSWQAFRGEVEAGRRPTWEDFCKINAGITETTHRNYYQCYQVVMARLKARGSELEGDLWNERPSNLTANQRKELVELIISTLTEKDTFTTLRKEFHKGPSTSPTPPNEPPPRSPSPVDIVFQAEHLKEIALAAGVPPGAAGKVAMMMLVRDYCATGNHQNIIRYWRREGSVGKDKNLNFPEK